MDERYRCALCGINLWSTRPDDLAKHAAHNAIFAADVQARIDAAR